MSQNDQTLALHAGHNTTKTEGTRAVPIYQTTSYVFDDTDHAAKLFSLAEPGYIYTRLNNPTADVLEQRLASLEGGIAAVATSSGSAALATTLLTLLKTGDHIVSSNSLYNKLIEFTKLSYTERVKLTENARDHVEKYFDEKLVINKYKEHIDVINYE